MQKSFMGEYPNPLKVMHGYWKAIGQMHKFSISIPHLFLKLTNFPVD